MMTVSGQHLTLDSGAPTIEDMALGLSRIPRFGGQTLVPSWSVAHHSLVVERMARDFLEPELELYGLLHDGHEMMTEDIPTTFKTPDMRSLQRRLDWRIYRGFGLIAPEPDDRDLIARLDTRALLAESYVVTPAVTYERIAEDHEQEALWSDVVIVQGVLHHYPTAEDARDEFTAQLLYHVSKWRVAA